MPGQVGSLKPRKRKRKSSSRKTRRKRVTRSKTQPAATTTATTGSTSGYGKADAPLERPSRISCECLQSAGRRRCSASPELRGHEGKENTLRTSRLDLDSCSMNCVWDKRDSEDMDCEDMFPDDDSNQILPVEQFFGNLDAVQDFPQRASATSGPREHRRRHYYAPRDSDEEEEEDDEGLSRTQRPDDLGDAW